VRGRLVAVAAVRALAIAHRAGNSLEALHQAVALGADVIEADVHAYRGNLEVRHLKTLGPLPFLWDTWELVPASRPRLGLRELLTAAREGTTFMLDLKGRHPTAGRSVARALHEHAPGRPVIVCSRYWPALDAFADLPWCKVVLSARTRAELTRLRERLRSPGEPAPYGVSIHRSLLTEPLVAELHSRVEVVMTWPVNDETALQGVLDLGVTGVISDELDIVRAVLAARSSE
jgi:glycerophosphoryl diester phosphodiesterase